MTGSQQKQGHQQQKARNVGNTSGRRDISSSRESRDSNNSRDSSESRDKKTSDRTTATAGLTASQETTGSSGDANTQRGRQNQWYTLSQNILPFLYSLGQTYQTFRSIWAENPAWGQKRWRDVPTGRLFGHISQKRPWKNISGLSNLSSFGRFCPEKGRKVVKIFKCLFLICRIISNKLNIKLFSQRQKVNFLFKSTVNKNG